MTSDLARAVHAKAGNSRRQWLWSDMVYSRDMTEAEALKWNTDLYVHGYVSFSSFESRVTSVLEAKLDGV